MASFGSPGGSGGQWTEAQEEALAPIIAAYWRQEV
jgi:hypothetical protein